MRQHYGNQSLIKKIGHAFSGIGTAFKNERNIRYQAVVGLFVIIVSFILHISKTDWALLLVLIALVIATELINTAIEGVVDLCTFSEDPLAKKVKDIAAGAVVVMAMVAIIGGILILSKYI